MEDLHRTDLISSKVLNLIRLWICSVFASWPTHTQNQHLENTVTSCSCFMQHGGQLWRWSPRLSKAVKSWHTWVNVSVKCREHVQMIQFPRRVFPQIKFGNGVWVVGLVQYETKNDLPLYIIIPAVIVPMLLIIAVSFYCYRWAALSQSSDSSPFYCVGHWNDKTRTFATPWLHNCLAQVPLFYYLVHLTFLNNLMMEVLRLFVEVS